MTSHDLEQIGFEWRDGKLHAPSDIRVWFETSFSNPIRFHLIIETDKGKLVCTMPDAVGVTFKGAASPGTAKP
jgi:hypothetical protein